MLQAKQKYYGQLKDFTLNKNFNHLKCPLNTLNERAGL